jgi:hypothetical protein
MRERAVLSESDSEEAERSCLSPTSRKLVGTDLQGAAAEDGGGAGGVGAVVDGDEITPRKDILGRAES